jgi:hypothetical protein
MEVDLKIYEARGFCLTRGWFIDQMKTTPVVFDGGKRDDAKNKTEKKKIIFLITVIEFYKTPS